MSKSKGNVVSPGRDRRLARRRHRARVHPLHRPARPGRGLVGRGRRGRAPLPQPALAPQRRGRRAARRRTRRRARGADLVLVRKAHWAIDKVTGDMSSGASRFNTAIAAVMELTNEISRLRDEAGTGAMRFALETANSLLFSFAPHAAADGYHLLTGRARLGGAVARRRPGSSSPRTRTSSSARSTASCATAWRSPADADRDDARGDRAGGAERARARRRPRRRQGRSSCPGKLVNVVVR